GVPEDRMRRTLLAGGLTVVGGVLLAGAAVARRPKHRLSAAGVGGPQLSSTQVPATHQPSTPLATSSSGSSTPTRAASSSAPPSGPVLVPVAEVPVGGATQVTDPQSGTPVYVLQLQPGQFSALSAICTHQGCTIDFV